MSKFTELQPLQHTNQTMNSLQIAELVQSRHDSVKRTIERLAEQEVLELPPMVDKKEKGRVTKLYVFSGEQGKLDSITVVAQLSPNFTAKLVQRWQQLEHLVSSSDYEQLRQQNSVLKAELLKQSPEYQTIKVMHDGGLQNWQIKMATNLSKSTVEKRLRTMRKLGLISSKRQVKTQFNAQQLEMGV